jgi:plastocyanin
VPFNGFGLNLSRFPFFELCLINLGLIQVNANRNNSQLEFTIIHFRASTMSLLMIRRLVLISAFGLALSVAAFGVKAQEIEKTLVIKNHQFEPAELKVPANQKIKLTVHNQDNSAEEFESKSLKREKVIAAGAKATLVIGPLKPGKYEFFGEFNPASAKGVVIAE